MDKPSTLDGQGGRETARAAPTPSTAPPARAPRLGVVDDPIFDEHHSRGYHPERPERLVAARHGIESSSASFVRVPARDARDEELIRVHTPAYLDELARASGREGHLDPDTYLARGSVAAARRAAGGACALVDAMLDGSIERGIALLRPPGHHARPGQAMGFCLLNNVAIAAAHARARGVARVAIVDWDVHHGNGTQEMFFADPSVLYASVHQWPFYPGSGTAAEVGAGDGKGFTINVPLSAGAGDAEYLAAFDRVFLPALESYSPELVLVSAGFDAHRDDPLAGMRLGASSYEQLTARLVSIAERCSTGRIALVLEGGYDLPALEESVRACVSPLEGAAVDAAAPIALQRVHEAEIENARTTTARAFRI